MQSWLLNVLNQKCHDFKVPQKIFRALSEQRNHFASGEEWAAQRCSCQGESEASLRRARGLQELQELQVLRCRGEDCEVMLLWHQTAGGREGGKEGLLFSVSLINMSASPQERGECVHVWRVRIN